MPQLILIIGENHIPNSVTFKLSHVFWFIIKWNN